MRIVQHFVRESVFDSKIKEIARSYERMHEFDQAIEWGLERNPKQFYNICEDFYLWKTERLVSEIPQLRILYRYVESEKTVYFVAVDEIKP